LIPQFTIKFRPAFLLVIIYVIVKDIIFKKANVITARIMINTENNYKMLLILPHVHYGKSSPQKRDFLYCDKM